MPQAWSMYAPYSLSKSSMRRRGAADGDAADGGNIPLRLFLEDGLDGDPHGGHGSHQGDALVVDDLDDVARLRVGPAEDLRGAVHDAGEGHTPGVGVEHGHDVQDHVALADAEHVHGRGGEAVEVYAAVRVDHALGVPRGAGGVAHAGGVRLVKLW